MLDHLNGWQMKPSKETYLLVKKALIGFTTKMQLDLQKEKNSYIDKTNSENSSFNSTINNYKNTYLNNPNNKANEEFRSLIKSLNSKWNSNINEINKDLISCNFEFIKGGIIDSIASSIVEKKNANTIQGFDNSKTELKNQELNIDLLIKDAIEKGKNVKNAKINYNNKVFSLYQSEESAKHRKRIELLDSEHRNNVANIVYKYSSEFSKVFNTSTFNTSYDVVASKMKPSVGYTCAGYVPNVLYFGKRTFEISSVDGDFFPEIVNMYREINCRGVSVSGRKIKITLPYCQTLEEGYSVFVENVDSNAENSKDIVKKYVMKMLMNFPAGQTRPVLLDNDSSSALTMFATIGESSGRGIITRPWAKEEDIETELRKVADERSNLSISYGDNLKSRLEREPIYYVAGRNFPKGFSLNSLSQLTNIYLAGAKTGFFALIQANKTELAEKEKDHNWKALLDDVKKNSMHIVEISNGKFILKADDGSIDEFEFDDYQSAMENSKEIISIIINGVSTYKRQIEKFEYLFSKDAGNIEKTDVNDMNSWYRATADKRFEIPIGISGASTVQKYIIDGVAQHALISGVTGSGKSALLRTMVVSTMMKYTPENVNMYLIDFKEGVEFESFSKYRLPWIRVVALNTEREFALNILRDLDKEFKDRAFIMQRYGATNIGQIKEKKYPRIILFFDEVQELLRQNDAITNECVTILARLVSEGRAMNINLILTSQDFTNCNGMDRLKANMVIRIAFKGSPDSAKSIMGEDFSVAQLEQGDSGYAAINSSSGAKGKTNFFQAGFLDENGKLDLLAKFQMTMQNKACNTRVMSSYASQDRNNKFNRLICNDEVDYSDTPKAYDLMIGDAFNISNNKSISISPKRGDNLLIVGEKESISKSIFALSILSILYDELACKARRIDNELVRLIDLSDEDEMNYDYFEFMENQFPHQITRCSLSDYEALINDTYENLKKRQSGEFDAAERLFLLFFGIDSAMALYQDMYDEEDEISTNKKLERIIKEGPIYGINSIFWSRSLNRLKRIIDNTIINKDFKKHMFFGANSDECDFLTGKEPKDSVKDNKAVMYKDMDKVNTSVFRPYEIPDKDWVRQIADTYVEFENRLMAEEE